MSSMSNHVQSRYWLDLLIEDIAGRASSGGPAVSSGHSPSGVYHVGTLREIMTADLIAWALRQRGVEGVRHLDVVDDLDAFRKVPAGVPEELKEQIGKPLCRVPDPFGCAHLSYADHYFSALQESLEKIGVAPEVIRSHTSYEQGLFVPYVEQSLRELAQVKRIITEVGRRELDEGWAPVQILSDSGSLREWRYEGWIERDGVIRYRTKDGDAGELDYRAEPGRVKLDWRLDWPARWDLYKVDVEPFGRDHATKGGSFDTGAVLAREIFRREPPYPVPYEFILPAGDTKKMSKSSGVVVTPADLLEVMPPEILRYFIARPRPGRTISFDTGAGLFVLIEEYTKHRAAQAAGEDVPDANALAYATEGSTGETISAVPFSHVVQVYQASEGDEERAREILARTGYEEEARREGGDLKRQLAFVGRWLEKFAPEAVKFSLQEELPKIELSDGQKQFLDALAQRVEAENLDGQGMHEAIYAAKDEAGIGAGEAFKALYRVLLNKDAGPRAGWFLASLDQAWLARRLSEASS